MDQTKAMIASKVIKIQGHFSARQITDMTGMSRQLVYYHLNNFVDAGLLEKIDKSYIVRSKERLIDAVVDIPERVPVELPTEESRFLYKITDYTPTMERVVAAKAMKMPESENIRKGYVDEIDKAIEVLQSMRAYLMKKQMSKKVAHKTIEAYDSWGSTAWDDYNQFIEFTKADFLREWQNQFLEIENELGSL